MAMPYEADAKAERESPFERLNNFMKIMEELEARAGSMADRIVGAIPRNGPMNSPAVATVPNGLVENMDRHVSELHTLADRITESLSRIERRL